MRKYKLLVILIITVIASCKENTESASNVDIENKINSTNVNEVVDGYFIIGESKNNPILENF